MITIIFGKPGVGKTALMTSFAVNNLFNGKAHWKQCLNKINMLNIGGFKLKAPIQKHMVFADYCIRTRKYRNYDIDGYRIGMFDESYYTMFLPPFSHIYLDEAQKYFDSRKSSLMSDRVSRFFEMHRHNNYDITLVCQRLGLIDLNVRQNAECIYLIESFKVKKDDYGRIVKCLWICRHFVSNAEAEKYYDNPSENNNLGEKVKLEFNGNVFKYYNSQSFEPLFYNNRYEQDFDINFFSDCDMTVDSVKEFNSGHSYSVPDGYYVKRGKL